MKITGLLEDLNAIIDGTAPEQDSKPVEEMLDSDQEDLYQEVMLTAENDGDSYRKKDAKGAAKKASKEILKAKMDDLKYNLEKVEGHVAKDLGKKWRKK